MKKTKEDEELKKVIETIKGLKGKRCLILIKSFEKYVEGKKDVDKLVYVNDGSMVEVAACLCSTLHSLVDERIKNEEERKAFYKSIIQTMTQMFL